MTMPQWKFAIIVIGIVLLLLHELMSQWWLWQLDHAAGTNAEYSSESQTLLSNAWPSNLCSTTYIEFRQGTSKITSPTVENLAYYSWDVGNVYDIEELEETNLSTSSLQDVQGKITARHSLLNIMSNWRRRRVNPKFPASKYPRSVPRPIPQTNSLSGYVTKRRPIPEQMNEGPVNATESSVSFIIYCAVGCAIVKTLVKLLHCVTRPLRKMKHQVCFRLNGSEHPGEEEEEEEEITDGSDNMDHLNAENSSDDSTSVVKLKRLLLSELPPDLEDQLVKKLDVPRNGEHLFGWEKVGAAFKISKEDLEYLKIEYRRDNGSPTSKLLQMLGTTKCKTVSDLINILKVRRVKRYDVASLITHYIKEANKSQLKI